MFSLCYSVSDDRFSIDFDLSYDSRLGSAIIHKKRLFREQCLVALKPSKSTPLLEPGGTFERTSISPPSGDSMYWDSWYFFYRFPLLKSLVILVITTPNR